MPVVIGARSDESMPGLAVLLAQFSLGLIACGARLAALGCWRHGIAGSYHLVCWWLPLIVFEVMTLTAVGGAVYSGVREPRLIGPALAGIWFSLTTDCLRAFRNKFFARRAVNAQNVAGKPL